MSTPAPPTDKGFLGMSWWSARHPPKDPTASFSGKTILITGANSGLGLEAAIKFAFLSASTLILGVRSLARGEEAKAIICARTGYLGQNIHLYELDMSTFASVKRFAEEVSRREEKIDVVILNAGMAAHAYLTSPEGYESSLQVNVLSTAYLALLLLPKLRLSTALTGTPTHLELVGSSGHRDITSSLLNLSSTEPVLPKINSKEFFNPLTQYSVTKLLLMYVAASLVPGTLDANGNPEVIITTICPGLCRTNIGRDFSLPMRIADGAFKRLCARSCEQGARTYVSGAALGIEGHGEFWSHDVFYEKGELVTSEEGKGLRVRVWGEILGILRVENGDVDEILEGSS